MSVIIFELKDDHIKLLRELSWSLDDKNTIVNLNNNGDELAPPFGFDTIYEAIDLILNGKTKDIDPFNDDTVVEYTEEQKLLWDKLYSELPTALEIILFNKSFETGKFKRRYHIKEWFKIQ